MYEETVALCVGIAALASYVLLHYLATERYYE
jgi:hypothetical protein